MFNISVTATVALILIEIIQIGESYSVNGEARRLPFIQSTDTIKAMKLNDPTSRSFHVKSSWSKAGIGTCFVLEDNTNKKFNVVFDLGCTPIFDKTMKANHVILSHVHLDHFGAIFGHARAHSMVCGGSVPTYYVPEEALPQIEKARDLFSDIDASCMENPIYPSQKRDKSLLKMNFVPVKAGEEIELKQEKIHGGMRYYLRPFDVAHGGHPALGYTIVSKTSIRKLKPEYKGMDGKELGKLVRNSVEINDVSMIEKVEVCYTGDTNIDGLLLHGNGEDVDLSDSTRFKKQGFTAPLILCEVTYILESDRQLAKDRGHMNLFDLEPVLNSHNWKLRDDEQDCEEVKTDNQIIFYHLSSRGRTAENILESMANALPKDLLEVSEVALASFPSSTSSHLLKTNGCISVADYIETTNQAST